MIEAIIAFQIIGGLIMLCVLYYGRRKDGSEN
jgi:hypothetical protein